MGFLDKLLNRNNKTTAQSSQAMTLPEDWDFYFSEINDQPASYFINLGLADIAPVTEKPQLCQIKLKMNAPRADGLSSSEEFDPLLEIEDTLIPHLVKHHAAIYAGRVTTSHHRIFYFYMHNQDIQDSTNEVMRNFANYHYHFDLSQDPAWSTYFNFLYPDEQSMQCLQNRRVVDNLEKNGDSLTLPRPVDHWIFFQTEKDLIRFITTVQKLGFKIVHQEKLTDHAELRYTLQISRTDPVDLHSINDYGIELWRLAKQLNGDYDGWETQIITN